ncbi:HAD family hydrolase [Streptomyces meridianus]|uniref:HAD-IA family hydrolase n=1 Tax=Streptomyces meridianus TaxID=2938945 RepID=A0ABT0X5V6_9ACTN|nr:HAD-IA family hydrolase [Streptomyces meridianus]MCM2577640.1 HAD-IA family hydrolase [Streptomyces meridianus]
MTAPTFRSFDALLCDFDGVLRLWDPQGMPGLDRAYDLPEGTLAAAAFGPERLLPAVTGKCTDEQWRASVARELARPCGSLERARQLAAEWSALTGEVDAAVLELLAEARRRGPVVLVSNATTRLESDLELLGLTGVFDAVVSSARIGMAKPESGIYRYAAKAVDMPLGRCLFVDDAAANVEAARTQGMAGVHYRSPADLRAVLAG